MKNNMNDFSSPIIDQVLQNKIIPNNSNANLFDKFINGQNENNSVPRQNGNNLIIKNTNTFFNRSFQNPMNLDNLNRKRLYWFYFYKFILKY